MIFVNGLLKVHIPELLKFVLCNNEFIYMYILNNNLILYVTHNFIGLFFKSMTP